LASYDRLNETRAGMVRRTDGWTIVIAEGIHKGDSGSICSTQGRGGGVGVSQGLPNFLEAKFNYLISFI
jgi:hypothetical protein